MANLFQQMKDVYKLKEMQNKMKKKIVRGESRDGLVVVELNGLGELENIKIDDELMTPEKKKTLVEGFIKANEQARKELQNTMAQEFDVESLQKMLGGAK